MRKVMKRSASKLTLLCVVIVTVLGTLSIPAALASSDDSAAAPAAQKVTKANALSAANRVATLTGTRLGNGSSKGAFQGQTVQPVLMKKNLKQTLRTSGAAAAAEGIASPQRGTPSSNFAPLANFPGLDSEDWGDTFEPNVMGDVGPDYYVQTVNSAIGVFDKSTGALLGADWLTDFFDAPTGGACQMTDDSDFEQASVMYDTTHDRWIVVLSTWDDPLAGPYYDCIAVTTSGNPLTGDWNVYQIQSYPNGDIYPLDEQWGLWTDGLYKSVDNYCDDACPAEYPDFGYVGIQIYGYNLDDLISGSALRWQTTTGTGHQSGGTFDYNFYASPTPATMRVQAGVPPAGRPEYFVGNEYVWGEINPNMDVWRWNVNWDAPASSVLSAAATVRAGSLTGGGRNYFQPRDQIPAPGGNGLDSNYDYPIGHIQYSNTAGNEALWASQTNDSATSAATARARARWYRFGINSATGALANSGGTTATQWQTAPNQGQDFAPDTLVDRWIPAVGVDKNGDMALGYNVTNARVANPLVYPSIWYTGREAADPVNTVKTPEQVLQTGTGFECCSNDDGLETEWTSSTIITLDPDGCTFWLTGEYLTAMPTTLDDNQWQTRVGSFAFPSCSPSLLATQLTAKGNGAGGTGTLKATLTATGTGSGVFGKTVDFTLDGTPVGSAVTNNDGVATLSGVDTLGDPAGVNAGVVGASFAGNADTYAASSNTGDLLETGATAQTISFDPLADKTFGDANFGVSATSDSSLTVSFSASGDCSVTGSTVHLKGAGSCTITASQDGDATYAAADTVDQTFAIAKGTQIITFGALTGNSVGQNKAVLATSSAGRQVQFTTTTPGVCTARLNGIANGARIDSNHAGTCTVEASVPGDSDYLPASVTQSFIVAGGVAQTGTASLGGSTSATRRIDQSDHQVTVTWNSGLPSTTFNATNAGPWTVTAAAGTGTVATLTLTPATHLMQVGTHVTVSGQGAYNCTNCTLTAVATSTISYASSATGAGSGGSVSQALTVCSTSGSDVTVAHTGACTITATQSGNADYNPGSLTVTKGITKGNIGNHTFVPPTGAQPATPPFVVTATGHAATLVADPEVPGVITPGALTSTTPGVCTVGATTPGSRTSTVTVTPLGAGTCTISAAGSLVTDDWAAKTAQTVNYTITKVNQTITSFDAIPDQTFGAPPVDLVATASSGLTVSFSAAGPCSIIAGPKVSIDGGGLCTVTASQPGNALYNAASPTVDRSFTIGVGGQTITLTGTWATDHHTFGDADFDATATASSGLDVTFTAAGACTVAGTPNTASVHLTGGGLCTITAHQGGNDDFDAAPNQDAAFTVFLNQTINGFAAIPNKTYGDVDFGFTTGVSATSGLPVTYSVTGPCAIVGPVPYKIHITGGGLCTVTAHQVGNGSYNPAPVVNQAFTINARATKTTLKIAPKTVASGGSITGTAKVKPVGAKKLFPVGSTVQFKVGTTVIGTGVVNSKGVAKATFTVPLAPGTYYVIAVLVGTPSFATSQSAATQNKLKVT